ncbi:MAG: tyrosine-type recombinase/integrase [Armatimonadetes bacterium]|nr:tyrosine-type recombinase/integrase [Armatimonadota bacterium]
MLSGRHKGKWRVQTTVKQDLGSSRKVSRLFPTQHEGKEFLRSLIRDEVRAQLLAAKELTLSEWFTWLADNDWAENLDEKTVHGRRQRFTDYVEEEFGKTLLTKIDPMAVREFYRKLKKQGVGHATREAIKVDLVRAFNQAISPYRKVPAICGNPFRIPIDAGEPREAVALTPKEAMKALRSRKLDDVQRGMLGVYLLGGLRLSEQMALTVGQVNFEQSLIYVDRAVKIAPSGKQTLGLPKGNKVRTAVMCDELARILKPLCEGRNPKEYVWTALSANQPRMKNLVYATWRTILADAKLPESMSPQDGRLTHYNWIRQLCHDVSETTLKAHIGHTGRGVGEIHYTRPISPAQALLKHSLDELLTAGKDTVQAA